MSFKSMGSAQSRKVLTVNKAVKILKLLNI